MGDRLPGGLIAVWAEATSNALLQWTNSKHEIRAVGVMSGRPIDIGETEGTSQ